jgi:hypothetical protein
MTISATGLRDYAKAFGWKQIQEAVDDRLFVMTNPDFPRRQLVFPMDDSLSDYSESVYRALLKLAEIQNQTPNQILNDIRCFADDVLRYRIDSPRQLNNGIPFAFAGNIMDAVRRLFLSAISMAQTPKIVYNRLAPNEGFSLLSALRFGQTEQGSFVLRVECPVFALENSDSGTLFSDGDNATLIRKTTVSIRRGLQELVTAIEKDNLDQIINEAKSSETPIISANFCEALAGLQDEELKNSVDLSFIWANTLPLPSHEERFSNVRIQHDYFPKIYEVARSLRPSQHEVTDTFIGTVEKLHGETNDSQRREGEVILSLFTKEGTTISAKVLLSEEDYAKAVEAHQQGLAYIQVNGKLKPGRQPKTLAEAKNFTLLAN